jgi:dihydrofolate reductase
MAQIVSTLFISLDGVAEVGESWHFPYYDENMARAVNHDYSDTDVLLFGRVTYDSFAGAWPEREAAGEDDAAFAASLGDLRKIVASRQRPEFSWRNTELLDGDLVAAATALKADPAVGRVLIPGSISVVQQLLAAGLVDELSLLVHPVAVRSGKRLFDDGDDQYHLRLLASEAFPTGVVWLRYTPSAKPGEVCYDEVKGLVSEISP